jgi:hypothetical protein
MNGINVVNGICIKMLKRILIIRQAVDFGKGKLTLNP